MSPLREQILSRLESADVYAQQLHEERSKDRPDRETSARLAQDAGQARKTAEVLALVRLGDLLSQLTGDTVHTLERIGDVLDIPCRVHGPEEFTGSDEPK